MGWVIPPAPKALAVWSMICNSSKIKLSGCHSGSLHMGCESSKKEEITVLKKISENTGVKMDRMDGTGGKW